MFTNTSYSKFINTKLYPRSSTPKFNPVHPHQSWFTFTNTKVDLKSLNLIKFIPVHQRQSLLICVHQHQSLSQFANTKFYQICVHHRQVHQHQSWSSTTSTKACTQAKKHSSHHWLLQTRHTSAHLNFRVAVVNSFNAMTHSSTEMAEFCF